MANGRRRVVVTGMGMVTPVGSDLESSWTALREGEAASGRSRSLTRARSRPGSRPRSRAFRSTDYRTDAQRWRDHCRTTQFALAAATMAMEHAGLAGAAHC